MKHLIALALLLSACTTSPKKEAPPGAFVALLSPPCVTPEAHGAIVDDGNDDRAALQAAIDAAQAGPGCLELTAGTYHVTWLNGTTYNASLFVTAQLDMFGPGESVSKISMLGTAISPTGQPRGWQLLSVTATNVKLHDFSLDGSERQGTNDQTHLLHVLAPTDNVSIERMSFNLPSIGPSSGGDCIRLLGAGDNGAKVKNTIIKNATGTVCDRSFVSFQRGVEGVLLADSKSIQVDQAPIDFEPTGTSSWGCYPAVKDVLIRDCVLARGPAAQGAVTVSISGDGCSLAENVTMERTQVLDGALHLIDVKNILLMDLDLKNRVDQAEPVFRVMKRAVGVRLLKSRVERIAGSMTGNVITVTAASGALPTDVQLDGVTAIQNVAGQPIEFLSGKSLVITKSSCAYLGPAPAPTSCVLARGIEQSVGQPVMVDSTWQGTSTAARVAGLNDGPPVLVRTTLAP